MQSLRPMVRSATRGWFDRQEPTCESERHLPGSRRTLDSLVLWALLNGYKSDSNVNLGCAVGNSKNSVPSAAQHDYTKTALFTHQ